MKNSGIKPETKENIQSMWNSIPQLNQMDTSITWMEMRRHE